MATTSTALTTIAKTTKRESLPIANDGDVVRVRHTVRTWSVELGFGLVDQTKVVTAASEIARNALEYGGGGTAHLEKVEGATGRKGLRIVFEDKGPGIADLTLAMKDGYTGGKGLGLGLPGAKRLVNEFDLASEVGKGTRVTLVRWK